MPCMFKINVKKVEENCCSIGVIRRICDIKFVLGPNIFTIVLTKFFQSSSLILGGHFHLRHDWSSILSHALLTYLLTHLLTYLLTHSLTHLLTYSLTHSLPHSLTHSLTNSMEQSPSWEANRFSASQEIPRILWKPECSLPHSQMPAICPYPKARCSDSTKVSVQVWGFLCEHFVKIHVSTVRNC